MRSMGRKALRATTGRASRMRRRRRTIAGLACAGLALLAEAPARADYVFELLDPRAIPYEFGTEFNKMNFGPTQFDVTASLFAIKNPNPGGTGLTLGCDAGDYAGFSAGSVALVYRGGCTFNSKAAIAQAAGAVGLLISESGGSSNAPGGADAGIPVDIPTFSTNFMVLGELPQNNSGLTFVRLAAGAVAPTVFLPVLENLTSGGSAYMFREDFNTALFGPSSYDITGSVAAVLNATGTDLSFGCDASDFSGFAAGSIAFVSRGTCTFNSKAALAQAAGAIGILIGNLAGDAIAMADSGIAVDIPAQSTSFELRNALLPLALDGTLTVRLAAGEFAAASAVPEPAAWAMMIAGFAATGGMLRRKRARRHPAVSRHGPFGTAR